MATATSAHIPLVDLKAQYRGIKAEVDAAIQRTLEATSFVLGPDADAFEAEFARFCGAGHCIATANGTDATAIALKGLGVEAGDEVITVGHTFIATAEGISELGATPVFVDVLPDTLLMDPEQVASRITSKTRAIVPVHLYGQMADMDPIMALAEKHGLKVMEDACQAHGATYKGARAGAIGDAGTFSFYPGKNLGAYGDAGAITARDAAATDWMRRFRNHGRATKYTHDFVGRNSRMDGLQAAVLRVKLAHLDDWTERRRAIAAAYRERLAPLGVELVKAASYGEPVYHLFVVRVKDRDRVLEGMKQEGIEAGVHYPVPLHLQKAYEGLGMKAGSLPVTEAAAAEILSLPIFPEMSLEQVDRVVAALAKLI